MTRFFLLIFFWASFCLSAQEITPLEESSFSDLQTADNVVHILRELKSDHLKKTTVQKLEENLKKSSLFFELGTLLPQLYELSKPHLEFPDFIKTCNPSGESAKSSLLFKEVFDRINIYCRSQFLKNYFKGSELKTIDELHYLQLKKWMVYYLKGESKSSFTGLLKRLKKNAPIYQEISFLVTEQSIRNKIYPPDDILKLIEVDRNLDIHVQRMAASDLLSKKYFGERFLALGKELTELLDSDNKMDVLDSFLKLQIFYDENKKFINEEDAWRTLISVGRKFLIKNYEKEALTLLSYASEVSDEDKKEDTLFYEILGNLLNNNPQKALLLVNQKNLAALPSNFSSRLRYFVGLTLLKNNESEKAEKIFFDVLQNSPLTFYSIVALKNISKLNAVEKKQLVIDSFEEKTPPRYVPTALFKEGALYPFKRLKIWAKMGLENLAALEINDVQNQTPDSSLQNPFSYSHLEFERTLYFHLIRILTNEKRYLLTFKVAAFGLEQGIIKPNKPLLGMLFPSDLLPLVKKHAKIDPFLILALIRQESAFNHDALSGAGARGLMQLLVPTAKKFRRGITKKNIFDPSINIEAGTKYFSYLLKMFDGNLIFALASYNAGENRVKEWKKSLFTTSDPLLLIESIPYKETRDYVKLIYRNYFYYKFLFNELDQTSIEESFKISF